MKSVAQRKRLRRRHQYNKNRLLIRATEKRMVGKTREELYSYIVTDWAQPWWQSATGMKRPSLTRRILQITPLPPDSDDAVTKPP